MLRVSLRFAFAVLVITPIVAGATRAAEANRPGPPAITSVTTGNGVATVSFNAPASDGGSPILNYAVSGYEASATGPTSPITLTGLRNNFTYHFTVTASNINGPGAPSPGTSVASGTPLNPSAILRILDRGSEGIAGDAIRHTVVNGNPAVVFSDSRGGIFYARNNAADGSGTWNIVVVQESSGAYPSIAIIDGRPAIAYHTTEGDDLRYVRALDINGSAWGASVMVDGEGNVGEFAALGVVAGRPAIGYRDATNFDVRYARAADATGSAWQQPTVVASAGSVGTQINLLVVAGQPALFYVDNGAQRATYIRALDADGVTWGTPRHVDSPTDATLYLSPAIVDGVPALAYYATSTQDLRFVRASSADGSGWEAPITLDSANIVGAFPSLAIVDARPAIAYYAGTGARLKYIRASDIAGSAWDTPVFPDTDTQRGTAPSLTIIAGRPSIAYGSESPFAVRYVRAIDATGAAWGASTIVDQGSLSGLTGSHASHALIDGRPVVAYYSQSRTDLYYIVANDALGSSWGPPIAVVADNQTVGEFASLAVVDGRPAIAYYNRSNGDLCFVRANDAAGTTWSMPLILDATGDVGRYASLAIVGGFPAVSYYDSTNRDLKYLRATSTDGSAWGAPVTVHANGSKGQFTSLRVVAGRPAIAYHDPDEDDLYYVRASDAGGTAWGTPLALATTGDTGHFASLTIVGGFPAISFFDQETSRLRYIRATDTIGSVWASVITPDAGTAALGATSLAMISGRPAIGYSRGNLATPAYIHATDAAGTNWGAVVDFDSSGRGGGSYGGNNVALLEIAGRTAIAYQPAHNLNWALLLGAPALGTPSVTFVASGTSTLSGVIDADGGSVVTARGFVYARTADNTTPVLGAGGVSNITAGNGIGAFTAGLSGLAPGTAYSFAAYATSVAGTAYSTVGTFSTLAGIESVTTPAAGRYRAVQLLDFAIVFNAPVAVTGTPRLALTFRETTVHALYHPAASTATRLVFRRIIATGDSAPSGIVIANSLDLNGGTITNSGQAAQLTFAAPTADGIIVDTTPPSVNFSVAPTSLRIGTTAIVTLTFSEPIVPFTLDDLSATGASLSNLATTDNITFTATLTPAPATTTAGNTLILDFNTINDLAGNAGIGAPRSNAYSVDTIAPTLNSVAIASNNADSSRAKAGDTITLTFTASEAITTPAVNVSGRAATVTNSSGNAYTATLTLANSDPEGAVTFSISVSDLAGNTGASVAATTNASVVIYDRAPPPVPAIIAISDDTGLSANDRITSDTTLRISGSAEAGSRVVLSRVGIGVLAPSVTADATTGAWVFDYTSVTLDAGEHTFTATATDTSGNVSSASAAFTVTVDTSAPVISSASVAAATYRNTFTFEVQATGTPVGFSATSLPNGLVIDTATGRISGAPASTGSFTLTLAATDAAGLTGVSTLTITVASAPLAVSGARALDKSHDGTTNAILDLSGATLTGVFPGDDVTLITAGASGAFATSSPGLGHPVAISGLSLAGAHSGRYTLAAPVVNASILATPLQIALHNLEHTYDGTAKTALVSVTPTVEIAFEYPDGIPVNAGVYAVIARSLDPRYPGMATGRLTIARAAQTFTFTAPATLALGTSAPVSAIASSRLPVTLSVTGPATLEEGRILFTGSGTATVTANQPGDRNHLLSTASISIASTGCFTQTISFPPITDRLARTPAFKLEATATSALPVIFSVLRGPALLRDDQLSLTGASGLVVVRASQPGNVDFEPAPDVIVEFRVSAAATLVYLAELPGGVIVFTQPPSDQQGSALILLDGFAASFDYTLQHDGMITAIAHNALDTTLGEPSRAAINGSATVSAHFTSEAVSGKIDVLALSFSARLLPPNGLTADLAGFYKASILGTTVGTVHIVATPDGRLFALARAPKSAVGGKGAIAANGAFTLAAPMMQGRIEADTTIVSGAWSIPDASPAQYAGLATTTARTDRLVNLSSRVRVGPATARTLIAGFVVAGEMPKTSLLRAVGPSLAAFNVANAITSTRLRLHNATGQVLVESDKIAPGASDAARRTGAFALSSGGQDAAQVIDLTAGAYTLHVLGGESGVVLAEIYDASINPNADYQRLINISTRGEAGQGDAALIGGFIITGNSPKRVLIRGIGPALAAFGLESTLVDPRLIVFSGSTPIGVNDDWAGEPRQAAAIAEAVRAVGAFALPAPSRDSAILLTLAPGAYTAQVSPAPGNAPGIALIEVYESP